MEVRWDSRLWRMWEWRWKGSMWWGEGREGKEGREGEERKRKGGEERRFSRPFAERGRAARPRSAKGRPIPETLNREWARNIERLKIK